MTAEGVTGRKRMPERDNMPTTSTNSCQWRETPHMPSTGVPKTGRSGQYVVHTDHKRVLERTSIPILLDCFFLFVVASGETSKKHLPDRGFNATTSINSGRCREAIHMASVGCQNRALSHEVKGEPTASRSHNMPNPETYAGIDPCDAFFTRGLIRV